MTEILRKRTQAEITQQPIPDKKEKHPNKVLKTIPTEKEISPELIQAIKNHEESTNTMFACEGTYSIFEVCQRTPANLK
jgi:predicted hydrolase (HD superfamily)